MTKDNEPKHTEFDFVTRLVDSCKMDLDKQKTITMVAIALELANIVDILRGEHDEQADC